MNFVPFIAVDNHKRSIVVGFALICSESIVNFKWVLNAFIKAHGKQPLYVVTDQCPAMKHAVPQVFTESKHRLCMWHIMKKLPKKVCFFVYYFKIGFHSFLVFLIVLLTSLGVFMK